MAAPVIQQSSSMGCHHWYEASVGDPCMRECKQLVGGSPALSREPLHSTQQERQNFPEKPAGGQMVLQETGSMGLEGGLGLGRQHGDEQESVDMDRMGG